MNTFRAQREGIFEENSTAFRDRKMSGDKKNGAFPDPKDPEQGKQPPISKLLKRRLQTKNSQLRRGAAMIGYFQLFLGGFILFGTLILGIRMVLFTSYTLKSPEAMFSNLAQLGIFKDSSSRIFGITESTNLIDIMTYIWAAILTIFLENLVQIYAACRLVGVCDITAPTLCALKGIRLWENLTLVSTLFYSLTLYYLGLQYLLGTFLIGRIVYAWHVWGYKCYLQEELDSSARATSQAKMKAYLPPEGVPEVTKTPTETSIKIV